MRPTAPAAKRVYSYLVMSTGEKPGMSFVLRPDRPNEIGRGQDCAVALTDPLCSRVHAIVSLVDRAWWVRDGGSRNGTYVNGQKIDEACLAAGHTVTVGSTSFTFHQSEMPPTIVGSAEEDEDPETVIRECKVGDAIRDSCAISLDQSSEQTDDLVLLYTLALRLLGCAQPGEVLRIALDLLHERTGATVVGFLRLDEEGKLEPKLTIPEDAADDIRLSASLQKLVTSERHAIWIANQRRPQDTAALQSYSDALCVPMVHLGRMLGALHVYVERGRFRQSHFDFACSLANITSMALVRSLRETSRESENRRLREKNVTFDEILGASKPMQELKTRISRIGPAAGAALVRGESGSGKELVARAIHRASKRADRPLLCVNCAAIPSELMESHLFGHKAGAFTGADRDHVGYFQQADLGTLFLDEIGELPLEGQAKLLRILEGHPFLPVGSTKEIKVDVRVVAATNQDLQTLVREKKFREDLYYRLSVFELYIPPLRDREGDIDLLTNFFLDHFRAQHGRRDLTLSDGARRKLHEYAWPGNVRQLRNVIDSAVVLAAGSSIQPGDLALRDAGVQELDSLRLDYWERKLIVEALQRSGNNVPDAARLLGIGRATLYRKIDEYGVSR